MKKLTLLSILGIVLHFTQSYSQNYGGQQAAYDDLYSDPQSANSNASFNTQPTTDNSNAILPYAWPQFILSGQDSILIYQPQVESFQGNVLGGRSAVQYIRVGQNPEFGVIEFSAHTQTDISKNVVYFDDLTINQANFPTLPDHGSSITSLISSQLPQQSYLSLDQVKSSLAINQATMTQEVAVKNDPPKLYFSTTPAALVLIDGTPNLKPILNSPWQRVINSSSFIVYNPKTSIYEIALFGHLFSSSKLEGPWQLLPQNTATDDVRLLFRLAYQKDSSIQTFNPPAKEIGTLIQQGIAPKIYVSTSPAELIITQGYPQYEPIGQTNLLYVKNTSASMFKYAGDGYSYVLVSGRWFKANDVNGVWSFVPPDQLPADFKNIPPDHAKGSVLSSIAGTPQAQEAVISSQIPQTAVIDRTTASLQTSYDGSPNFQPINGTNLQYAINSGTPIIFAENAYYALNNGVWYVSSYPTGPWAAATYIPTVIYTIPPSSPLHYVTYVQVYGYTPTVIYTGYTSGYYGCYVNPYGTVVYGTGYRYHPWVGNYWYGNPYSYGMGASFHWSNWGGWNMSFGYGAAYYPVYRPWWGPIAYRPYYNRYYTNHYSYNIYRNNQANMFVNRPNYVGGYMVRNQFVPRNNFQRNNYFAGRDGAVYQRNNNGGWQNYRGNNGWQNVNNNHPINNQYNAYQQGNIRTQTQQNFQSYNNGGFNRGGGFNNNGGSYNGGGAFNGGGVRNDFSHPTFNSGGGGGFSEPHIGGGGFNGGGFNGGGGGGFYRGGGGGGNFGGGGGGFQGGGGGGGFGGGGGGRGGGRR